jgi:hypothetical protein
MLSQEIIKKLKDDQTFIELKDWIIEKVSELDSLAGLGSMTNELAGEEAKVRAKTVVKLQQIFSPFIDFREKKEPTQEEIKTAETKYGL